MLVFLIGFMGSGKSSLGKLLARKLNYSFVDLDNIIEERAVKKILMIFSDDGEEAFRKVEHDCLIETFSLTDTVIATGGGTPCFSDNIEQINKNGISVYLKYDSGILASRLFANPGNRPLIKQCNDKQELKNYIDMLLYEREIYYLRSKFVIESKKLNAKKIIELIEGCVS